MGWLRQIMHNIIPALLVIAFVVLQFLRRGINSGRNAWFQPDYAAKEQDWTEDSPPPGTQAADWPDTDGTAIAACSSPAGAVPSCAPRQRRDRMAPLYRNMRGPGLCSPRAP